MAVGSHGLAHALLSASTGTASVAGGSVIVGCDTSYLFANTLAYTIDADNDFDSYVRVPPWYDTRSSIITVGGISSSLSPDATTGMHKVSLQAGQSSIAYTIGAALRTEDGPNNTLAV